MNRSFGWGATALVATATMLAASRQAGNGGGPSAPQQNTLRPAETAKANPGKPAPLDALGGCKRIEDVLQKFFLIPADGVPSQEAIQAPDECFTARRNASSNAASWKQAANAHFMIALLPDPIRTHLAGTFDQLTESIERAAQAEKFTYDSSWLPWRDPDPSYSSLADDLAAKDLRRTQEEQPGILLFRSLGPKQDAYDPALIIFVVGEQATAGINKAQFENAVAWIDRLKSQSGKQPDADPLTIVGPYSSGSFASLQQMLTEPNLATRKLEIASGTASDQTSILDFQGTMASRLLIGNQVVTFNESTDLEIQRYLQLLGRERYDPCSVALMAEDETSFGSQPDSEPSPKGEDRGNDFHCPTDTEKSKGKPDELAPGLKLYYPRDISGLRTAYQKQGLTGSENNQAEYASHQRLLPEDLSEKSEEADDTIKTYSGAQVDFSDEAELLQLVLQLQVHHVEHVLLLSSNPLDQVFLARFLRSAAPSVRVVILGANQELFRDRGATELRGVVMLSPYLLSPVVEDWTEPQTSEKQIFTTDLAQGLYYATSYLVEYDLRRAGVGRAADMASLLPGYAAPFWIERTPSYCVPPTWVSVVSTGRPWPVAAIDERTLQDFSGNGIVSSELGPCDPDHPENNSLLKSPQWLLEKMPKAPAASGSDRSSSPPSPPFKLPMSYELPMAAILCFLWALGHGLFRDNASTMLGPRCRAYFALTRPWAHSLLLNLSWGSIGVAAFSLLWFARHAGTISGGRISWVLMTLRLTCLICAIIPIVDWRRSRPTRAGKPGARRDYPEGWRGAVSAFVALALVALFAAPIIILTPIYSPATSVPEALRALNLFSGVSPGVPIAILAAGAYFWCLKGLSRLAMFNEDRPLLPAEKSLEQNLEAALAGKDLCVDYDKNHPLEAEGLPANRSRVLNMFARENFDNLRIWKWPVTNKFLFFIALGVLAVLLLVCWGFGVHLGGLGALSFGQLYGTLLLAAVAVMTVQGFQLVLLWLSQRELLEQLDRLPLRRTLRNLGDFTWNSVWAMSGAAFSSRYQMLSRQSETLHCLSNAMNRRAPVDDGVLFDVAVDDKVKALEDEIRCKLAPWYAKKFRDQCSEGMGPFHQVQEKISELTAALLVHVLVPAWGKGNRLPLSILEHARPVSTKGAAPPAGPCADESSESPIVRAAEEFVSLNYLAYVQNALGGLRALVIGMAWLFLAATVACTSYPYEPRPMLSAVFTVVFILLAGIVILVYAQAHRDTTLSNVTHTVAGSLDADFYLKVLQFGLGPLLGLVSLLYPPITNFFFSLMQSAQFK